MFSAQGSQRTHAHFDHVGSLDVLAQALPNAKIVIGEREARLLRGDFSLDPNETGKPFFGFKRVRSSIHRVLNDGDQVGSLRVVASPGHTPGHIAFLDIRDNSLLAGDSYITQKGVIAAGVYSFFFPMPAWFSWNCALATLSAARLAALKPTPARRRPRPLCSYALRTNGPSRPIRTPTKPDA